MKTLKIALITLALSSFIFEGCNGCNKNKNGEGNNADTATMTQGADNTTNGAESNGNAANNMGSNNTGSNNAGGTGTTGTSTALAPNGQGAALSEGTGPHGQHFPVDSNTNRYHRPDTTRTQAMDGN